jgi:hypothetical protein
MNDPKSTENGSMTPPDDSPTSKGDELLRRLFQTRPLPVLIEPDEGQWEPE